jgi:hypothetical protein
MVAFSPSALRLIDSAVTLHTDTARVGRWQSWKEKHPEIQRRPGAHWAQWGDFALPSDIVETMLLALDRLATQLRHARDAAYEHHSEDEVSELDNELSQILSIERFIQQAPSKRVRRHA